jgi:hypothetical protein
MGKWQSENPLRRSNCKKQVFMEYLEDENLWMKDTWENVDLIREKQDCCQRELDSYKKSWDRFRAKLDYFQEGTVHSIKDTVIPEVYNRLEVEWDLFQIGVKRFIRRSKRFSREMTDVLTEPETTSKTVAL